MRSFRLDRDSISEFLDSWKALLCGLLLTVLFAYVGLTEFWGRFLTLIWSGIYGGYLLRGRTAETLRETYPGARFV